jgi:hypothetical protein
MPQPDSSVTATALEALATHKKPDLEEATTAAISDSSFLQQLFLGLTSKNDVLRYNCFKVLQEVSARNPASLYPRWGDLLPLLDSPNAYHRSVAVRLLANLSHSDADRRFAPILDRYFGLLDDEKILTARYLVAAVPTIVEAYPDLIPLATAKLLAVDGTHHPQGRKDLLKGDIVEAFDALFVQVPDRERVISFVRAQLKSSSPRTRKAARTFLERHGG